MWTPWLFVGVFLASSFLLIWRLEALSAAGFQGTVLGALVMPYCTGLGNLIFAYILGRDGGHGADVMVNSLVNNLTNFTLILGVPALLWRLDLKLTPKKANRDGHGGSDDHRQLEILFTLLAGLFFTAFVWVMNRRGQVDFNDGLILIGLFLFWQSFHVLEVLKAHSRQGNLLKWTLPLELAAILVAAYGIYVSTGWLLAWVDQGAPGFIRHHLGWVSGWLMVLPNAVLAFYYGWRRRGEVVYASQVGDAHISLPLCLGVYALFRPLTLPSLTAPSLELLAGVIGFHLLLVASLGRLPRWVGLVLLAAFGYFLYVGWFN